MSLLTKQGLCVCGCRVPYDHRKYFLVIVWNIFHVHILFLAGWEVRKKNHGYLGKKIGCLKTMPIKRFVAQIYVPNVCT